MVEGLEGPALVERVGLVVAGLLAAEELWPVKPELADLLALPTC